MAKFYDSLTPDLTSFIENQKVFFVATAAPDGRINLSPKGLDSLRVLEGNRVLWMNLTGSGNETAAHLKEANRMTIMFCAFEGKPLILRLYGSAKAIHAWDEEWDEVNRHFPENGGARQVFDMTVDSLQTSCGFGVPFMAYQEDRDTLNIWSANKGQEGVQAYWKDKNGESIDGKSTGMLEGLSL